MSKSILTDVDTAIAAFEAGEPVLIHDGTDREHEVDLLYPAGAVSPGDIARLRNDAGGVIFVALPAAVADACALPFLHEAIDHPSTVYADVKYDARPSFSLSVNHRETYTGVTDNDRSTTIRAIERVAANPSVEYFAREFRSPGHVHLLRGAEELLDERQGHTEYSLAIAELADGVTAVAGAEMLDDATGDALSPADARAYARRNDLVYLAGHDIRSSLD